VAAVYKRVNDNLRAKRGIPAPPMAAAPAMVAAMRVIMLMELRRRVFQFSRCFLMFVCISTLSATASRMTLSWVVAMVLELGDLSSIGAVVILSTRNDPYTNFSQQSYNKLMWLVIFYYFFTKRKQKKTKIK
jgi:hypothetical protein